MQNVSLTNRVVPQPLQHKINQQWYGSDAAVDCTQNLMIIGRTKIIIVAPPPKTKEETACILSDLKNACWAIIKEGQEVRSKPGLVL